MSRNHRAGTQKHPPTVERVNNWKQSTKAEAQTESSQRSAGLAGGWKKKGKKKKKFATVSCTPESEEPPPNHRTRSSWAALALARGEAALSEPTSSPGRCPSMAAAVAAGLCLRCTVRGQVELSPSESNRLRPVPVIARLPCCCWLNTISCYNLLPEETREVTVFPGGG
jgi:hypothetical protein